MRDAVIWLRAQWDRVTGTALIAAGAIILVVTFQNVANSKYVADQIATVTSGGLGALFLVAVGVMLRLQADLHDEWRKLDRIEQALRQEDEVPLVEPAHQPETPARARVVAPVAGLVLALAVIAIGFQKAANTGSVDNAITGLAVGVAGLGLAALVVAAIVLVSRARLAGRKSSVLAPWLRPSGPLPALAGADSGICVASGLTRFHRKGCPTLASTTYDEIPREAVPGELRPCQICGAQ